MSTRKVLFLARYRLVSAEVVVCRVREAPVRESSGRLLYREIEKGGNDEARYAGDIECRAPAVVVGHEAANHDAEGRAQIGGDAVYRCRHGALLFGKIIAYERYSRRRARRFAHPYAHPKDEDLPGAAGNAAQSGHAAPENETHGEQRHPRLAVGKAGGGQRQDEINEGEPEPGHQPHHRVGQDEFFLDRLDHHAEYASVHVAERPDDREKSEHPATLCRRYPKLRLLVGQIATFSRFHSLPPI